MDATKIVSRDPEVMGGELVFTGTRVEVKTLIDYLKGGHTLDDFLEGFPTVPRGQAKMLSTLDALSYGRLIVGVGAGWLSQEFEALGVPFDKRGALTDEYLEAMKALWTSDGPTSFHGPTTHFENVLCEPKPVQRPHPPLWIGGGSGAALRRAAKLGSA